MKKNPLLMASLILTLCSPLAAQEHRDRGDGNFGGGDRSGGDRSGGGREPGGNRDNSDNNEFKERPARVNHQNNAQKPNRGGAKTWNSQPNRGNQGGLHHFNNNNPNNVRPQVNHAVNRSFNNDRNRSFNNNQNQVHHEISPAMRRIGVKRIPSAMPRHDQFLRADAEHSRFNPPTTGPKGESMHANFLAPKVNASLIQSHMKTFALNANFSAQVNLYNSHEVQANHYYWHNWNGTSYCHYYDNWGYHWYGWYWHGSCFWSRWYGNYWWWYDPDYSRWCYWNDGNWWWNDPYHVNVVYVYHDGDYVASSSTSVDAPSSAPALSQPGTEVDFKSRDGSRTVKVFGEDAFLYDTDQDGADNKPVYLASNVKEVKFSKPAPGKPMQVMIILNDGSFQMFDSDGNPYNGPQEQP